MIHAWVLAGLLAGPLVSAPQDSPKAKPAAEQTADEKFAELSRAFMNERNEYFRKLREYQQFLASNPSLTYPKKFLALAKENPNSEVAGRALAWIVQFGAFNSNEVREARELLLKDYASSPHIVAALPALARDPNGQQTLQKLLDDNPSKDVKGISAFLLAQARSNAQRPSPEQDEQAIALYERIQKEFADVSYQGQTLGTIAEGELFVLKNLKVGKPMPELAGADVDDVPFKLSDYKGKVVLLDFWGDW